LLSAGCQPGADDTRTFSEADNVENTDPHDHAHAHGPHEGHLVELGGEDYHAEVTFDPATRMLAVYLLNSDVKTPLPTDAESVSARLEIAGAKQEFKLSPARLDGDPEGQSSHFELTEGTIPDSIKDAEDLQGEIVVTIGGAQYGAPSRTTMTTRTDECGGVLLGRTRSAKSCRARNHVGAAVSGAIWLGRQLRPLWRQERRSIWKSRPNLPKRGMGKMHWRLPASRPSCSDCRVTATSVDVSR
jgi:hypothetical protein